MKFNAQLLCKCIIVVVHEFETSHSDRLLYSLPTINMQYADFNLLLMCRYCFYEIELGNGHVKPISKNLANSPTLTKNFME